MRIICGATQPRKSDSLPLVSQMDHPKARRQKIRQNGAYVYHSSAELMITLNILVDESWRIWGRSISRSESTLTSGGKYQLDQEIVENLPKLNFSQASTKLSRRAWFKLNYLWSLALKPDWNGKPCMWEQKKPSSACTVEEYAQTNLPFWIGHHLDW